MHLNMLEVRAALSLFGNEFHAARPAYENAHLPSFVRYVTCSLALKFTDVIIFYLRENDYTVFQKKFTLFVFTIT